MMQTNESGRRITGVPDEAEIFGISLAFSFYIPEE
jgi:hypothetical protein